MTVRKLAMLSAAVCGLVAAGAVSIPRTVDAHGNVTPQPVDVSALPPLEAGNWLTENPYSKLDDAKKKAVIEVGSSAYNQNCARCHGLQVISGGIAPDLRYLELGKTGDEWFIQRIRNGKKNADGASIMPAFEQYFPQEAMWAIRTFIESVHQE